MTDIIAGIGCRNLLFTLRTKLMLSEKRNGSFWENET
jgi:hypothetical protein